MMQVIFWEAPQQKAVINDSTIYVFFVRLNLGLIHAP